MKSLFRDVRPRFFLAALSGLIIVLFSLQVAHADPTTSVGKACNLSDGAAGTVVQQSGVLVCKESNSGSKNPRTEPIGYNGANNTAKIDGSVVGTCSEFKSKGIISPGGFVGTILCTNSNANATQVIIENLANYILGLGSIIFLVVLGLGFVQIMTGGGSPEALKAGKRRISLALMSIALFVAGRIIIDLLGLTGGKFLGVVDVQNFTTDTISQLIRAVWNYILFIGGFLSVFMIVYGGFTMLTSAGNPQRIQSARRIITYAVIGLVGLVGAGLIYNLVSIALTGR